MHIGGDPPIQLEFEDVRGAGSWQDRVGGHEPCGGFGASSRHQKVSIEGLKLKYSTAFQLVIKRGNDTWRD